MTILETIDVDDVDEEQLDVSGYKTPRGAAIATARRVRGLAEVLGHDPDVEVTVQKREGRLGDRYVVFYEGGPADWAIKLTGGEAAYVGVEPEVEGLLDGAGFHVECEYSFALAFYDD